MGEIICREEADTFIAKHWGDCFAEIDAEALAALARGDSLLFVVEEEYTLEVSLAAVAPPQDEDDEYDREDECTRQRQQRLEAVCIEDKAFIGGRKPTPPSSASRLVGIVRKSEAGEAGA